MTTFQAQDGWVLLDPGGRAVFQLRWVGRGFVAFNMTDDKSQALRFDADERHLAEATAEACRNSEPDCGVTAVPLHLTDRDLDEMWDAAQHPC